MKVGILSDTHDNIRSIERAMDIFRKHACSMIFHCGDWVAPFSLEAVGNLAHSRHVPVYGVLGNNLGDVDAIFKRNTELPAPVQLTKLDFLELPLGNKKVVITHGHNIALLNFLRTSGTYKAVFTGHTHKASIEEQGSTLIVNPGATCFVVDGQSAPEASVAIYDSITHQAQIIQYEWSEI